MEWRDNMIEAKLFKSKNIRGEWVTAAEQLEDFINSNLIDKVIKIVKIEEEKCETMFRLYTETTQLLLIFNEVD